MKTEAFKEFEQQFHAKGYERAQGFNPKIIASLEGSEAALAEEMLLAQMEKGDPTTIRALSAINSPDIWQTLSERLKTLPAPSMVHAELAEVLLERMGGEKLVEELLKDLEIPTENERAAVVQGLYMQSRSDICRSRLLQLLKNDTSQEVRAEAARGLLFMGGHIDNPMSPNHKYRNLVLDIANGDSNTVRQAVAQLESIVSSEP